MKLRVNIEDEYDKSGLLLADVNIKCNYETVGVYKSLPVEIVGDKTARELFEQIGYEYTEDYPFITYQKGNAYIEFDTSANYFSAGIGNKARTFSMSELCAIRKQCEELDWIL